MYHRSSRMLFFCILTLSIYLSTYLYIYTHINIILMYTYVYYIYNITIHQTWPNRRCEAFNGCPHHMGPGRPSDLKGTFQVNLWGADVLGSCAWYIYCKYLYLYIYIWYIHGYDKYHGYDIHIISISIYHDTKKTPIHMHMISVYDIYIWYDTYIHILCICVCLSVCLSGWLYVCMSVCLSVCMYVCMFVCLFCFVLFCFVMLCYVL